MLQKINDIVNPESSNSNPQITPTQYKAEIDDIIK